MLSVRNSIQEALEHHFRKADRHTPDCSAITDAQLQQAIASRWPVVDGVARISFGFSSKPLWSSATNLINIRYWPEQIQNDLAEMMQTTLRFSLKIIEKASLGKIEFIEDKNIHVFSRGIFFYLSGDENKFFADEMSAYAHRKIDNNGFIQQAYIFMPSNAKYWDQQASITFVYIWIHEIMHALGFKHLHEFSDMRSLLQNMQDGLYCSVLPYPEKISTAISKCTTHCNPSYAVYPGPLDNRLLQLAYVNDTLSTDHRDMYRNYFVNSIDIAISSFFLAILYKNIFTFFTHILHTDNQPILTNKMAALLTDFTFTAAIYFLEIPLWLIQLFAITTAIKYLPRVNGLSDDAKTALESLGIVALNLGITCMRGQQLLPLIFAIEASLMGTFIGNGCNYIGRLLATTTNQASRLIKPPAIITEPTEEVAIDIESQTFPVILTSAASANAHAFFNAKRRVSLCTRFTSWIRGSQKIDENQDLLTTTNFLPKKNLYLSAISNISEKNIKAKK